MSKRIDPGALFSRTGVITDVRAAEDEDNPRRVTLSFSSEEPYRRWFGMEILDHGDGAVDLERLNSVGVLLFNHDTDKVLGKVERAWIENRRGYATVIFDDDDFSEMIFKKVSSGTLKTTSVRYLIDKYEDVKAGVTTDDGFVGPCTVARSWAPLEISVVAVPADATVGVGRTYSMDAALDCFERQIKANQNLMEVMQK